MCSSASRSGPAAAADEIGSRLCAYDGARLPRWVVADAASTHPSVVTGQREAVSAGYLSPPALPPRCERALPPPPAHAEALGYRDDLRSVRNFIASRAEQAGLGPPRISDLVIAVSELAANTVKGLWLVNQLCDLVQARTSHAGTVARLHMRLGQPARQLQTSPGQSSAECY